jgi:TatA/E family protein of Tat protein translocase
MNPILGFAFSEYHLIIIIVLALVLFGGRKLPELGRSLGKGIVEFKKGLKGMEDETEVASTGGSTGQVSAPQSRQEPVLEQPKPPARVTAPAPKFEDAAPKFEDKPAVAPPSQPQS